MDLIYFLIDFILHIDVHLAELVAEYGVWVYAILFLILFCETGLVVTPFLPGILCCLWRGAGVAWHQRSQCARDGVVDADCRDCRRCSELHYWSIVW